MPAPIQTASTKADLRLPEPWATRARKDVPLSRHTTFRIGGPAAQLIEIAAPAELGRLAADLAAANVPWRLLGGGSNVLVADEGYDGLVVVFQSPASSIRVEGERIIASGGAPFHDLAVVGAAAALTGMEFAAGIPGTVGGAIFGNAGAFGEQVGDVLESLELLDRQGHARTVGPEALGFAYRHSALKETGEIVLSATLRLKRGSREAAEQRLAEILALRAAKHPDWRREPCAGSFFRNLAPTSAASKRQAAGAFLDQAGAKTMRVGGAYVYAKHANIILNDGAATARDVLALAERMRAAVRERFGIDLQREVIVWPDDLT
ncbi:MAG: UDP-N-acetylmuramate dehydrogenase [Myxococcales bacterium]|nr:MAG: UDP-N-acetylmuramate dehydrogenase [Myxococcales bacterium]